MYICCDRYNNPVGRAKTEKEAQEICNTLGSSYMKIIPILFWIMRNYNRFYTYNTNKGFLKYSELMEEIKKKLKEECSIKNYTSSEYIEKTILLAEEFIGDCSDIIIRKIQSI